MERLQHSNDVMDAGKQRSILLTVWKCHLQAAAQFSGARQAGLHILRKLFKQHYDPKPSPIVQRLYLNQATGETIATYVAALSDLAIHCEFGEILSEKLRDCLVCGVNHKEIFCVTPPTPRGHLFWPSRTGQGTHLDQRKVW